MVDWLPDRTHRLECLGNAVYPAIAQWIGSCIRTHAAIYDMTDSTETTYPMLLGKGSRTKSHLAAHPTLQVHFGVPKKMRRGAKIATVICSFAAHLRRRIRQQKTSEGG